MINILFVDDEPNILEGLKRMLRSMRHEWQTVFATSGTEALTLLQENKVDVVVSDMKMPGMDGAQFLEKVQIQYPHIVRIILSGYSEKAMILKSVGTAHQYLSKPCESQLLKEVISRACALRCLLMDENLREIVSQMHSIPSMPVLYDELLKELNLEDPKIKKISEIIKTDIGMTVKVLQIINSAFFGLRRTISDANEAIRFLGLETISSLALGIGIFSQFESKIKPEFLTKSWEHSIAVGNTAKKIAQSELPKTASDAFTAGLIHDIGELVLAVNLPEQYAQIDGLAEKANGSRSLAEKKVFGSNHDQVGGYLLGLWGLPESVVEAVAFHHTPSETQTNSFTPLTAVHVSNIFHKYSKEEIFEEPEKVFDVRYLEELCLINKIPVWYEKFMQPSELE